MKILELGKFYPPERGGIETLLKSFCEGFAQHGAQVQCVVANRENKSVEEVIGGVRVHRVASFGQALSTSIAPQYLSAARAVDAGIWHTHFPNPLADVAILRAPANVKIVVTYHSDIIRQASLLKLYGPLLRRCLSRADAIVVASPPQFEASELLQKFREKVRVIPFGIELRKFEKPHPLPAQIAKPRGPILLSVGRLVGYKGHRWLIEAMAGLNATLWLVGSGPLEGELRRQAAALGLSNCVQFLGNVADEDLPALYQACDIFVLPSVTPNEAFGIVQLEAMACGKPVISCDLASGVPWVNQHERTGLIVPPENAGALRAAAQRLIEDPARRLELGANARDRVEREFTVTRMVDDYYSLFQKLSS